MAWMYCVTRIRLFYSCYRTAAHVAHAMPLRKTKAARNNPVNHTIESGNNVAGVLHFTRINSVCYSIST